MKVDKIKHSGYTIWLSGLPSSGKTTIAKELINKLKGAILLDGDFIRDSLCSDLSFTPKDRLENIRRISTIAQILNEQNKIVVCSFVSPTFEIREPIFKNIQNIKYFTINTDLDICINRDVNGLYKKALNNEIPNLTGIQSPYEIDTKYPLIDGGDLLENNVNNILRYL